MKSRDFFLSMSCINTKMAEKETMCLLPVNSFESGITVFYAKNAKNGILGKTKHLCNHSVLSSEAF